VGGWVCKSLVCFAIMSIHIQWFAATFRGRIAHREIRESSKKRFLYLSVLRLRMSGKRSTATKRHSPRLARVSLERRRSKANSIRTRWFPTIKIDRWAGATGSFLTELERHTTPGPRTPLVKRPSRPARSSKRREPTEVSPTLARRSARESAFSGTNRPAQTTASETL